MPTAQAVQLADAVVAALNGHDFTQAFTAERSYVPVYNLTEEGTLKVPVVAWSVADRRETRATWSHTWKVQVGVLQKPASFTTAALDALLYLAEEIREYLERTVYRLPSLQEAYCLDVENSPLYDWDHYEQLRQFTSLITATYRMDS